MQSNTKKFGESGAWRGWQELSGDINWEDYGGKWCFRDPNNPRHFYVIRHDNMAEHMSEREIEESGLDLHVSTVYLVDLADTCPDTVQSAMECCGLDFDDWMTPPTVEERELAIVDCLVSYGAAAPMGEETHPHRADVARANARRQVEALVGNSDRREALLSRPVNAIGSTAREYARGDFGSAMSRARAAYRPDDWMPYAFGYMAAMGGQEMETGEDLAPEYSQGYGYGLLVKAGDAEPVPWIKGA
jgi:hypothetical protein